MYFASNRPGGFGGNDANEASPAIFGDDTTGVITLYFDSNQPGGPGPFTDDPAHNGNDIYASILEPDDTFGPAVLVTELSTPSSDRQPVIRRDGLELFFASDRSGGFDLWVSTRATTWDPWLTPVNLGSPVDSTGNDTGPALSFDATSLYFQSNRPGGFGAFDLYVTTRAKLKGPGVDQDED
jgi:Tol biopolymer transport system component